MALCKCHRLRIHIYQDDWLLNPIMYLEKIIQTANPIISLFTNALDVGHMFGNCVQCNSRSFLPSSRRIKWWRTASRGSAHPAAVVTPGAHSFTRETGSILLTAPTMVSSERSPMIQVNLDQGTWDACFCFGWGSHNSYTHSQRTPTRNPIDRCIPLHGLKYCELGCSNGQAHRCYLLPWRSAY